MNCLHGTKCGWGGEASRLQLICRGRTGACDVSGGSRSFSCPDWKQNSAVIGQFQGMLSSLQRSSCASIFSSLCSCKWKPTEPT